MRTQAVPPPLAGVGRVRVAIGVALGAAAAAAYLIGSGRVFGYDSAVTFANFIATPNLLDAFAIHSQQATIPLAQIAGNDHVLVSLWSHLIYSLTGTRSEVVYRLLPAIAAGATAGVTAAVLVERFGVAAGVSAGLYVATNPMFVENSRDLRGYSVATLFGLLATIVFFGKWTRWRLVLYGVLLGLAIAAHAYAGLVLVAHLLWIVARRSWGDLPRLAPAWALAVAIAVAANGYILWVDVTQHGFLPKQFTDRFPLWALRRERFVWVALALVIATAAALWLVIEPYYLYPRFFIFVIPGVAYLIAGAVKRWKVLAPVVMLGAVAAAVSQVPGYTDDPLALRQAAAAVQQGDAAGKRVCLIHSDEQVLGAYRASGFTVVTDASQLASCDEVVVVSWAIEIPVRDEAAAQFQKRTVLPAEYPTVVLEK
ncbi:MAG: hypothetical protein E6I98_04095 [Chloroflexi bacterium]|nr:MAG: hypothetical protein E6I98_04095 [Chloroflexota bacterium]